VGTKQPQERASEILRAGLPLWQSGLVVALLLLLWLAAPGPRESVAALGFAGMGFWVMLCPPDSRIPRGIMLLAVGCLLLPLLSFLPLDLGPDQAWREDLEETGLSLGRFLTAQPELSLSIVLWQAAVGLMALRLVAGGHREENLGRILLLIVLALLAYGGLSMLRPILIPEGVFSFETGVPEFGFFPNHNHSATLLAVGMVLSLGLLLHGANRRKMAMVVVGALAVLLVTYWLVFCNLSRAGILLSAGGVLTLLLLQGLRRKRRTGRWLMLLALLLGGVVFYAADEGVKKRLFEEKKGEAQVEGLEEDIPTTLLDGRWDIYRDTFALIGSQPLTGVGAGQFADSYPQFQKHSIRESGGRHVHPESSWFWIASEGGVALALALLGLVVVIFARCWKSMRKRRKRGLRPALLVAGALPFAHALVDVPLHRESILWMSALLAGLASPVGPDIGARAQWMWRGSGALVGLLGVLVLTGVLVAPSQEADDHLRRARELLEQDANLVELGAETEGPDLLEAALGELDAATTWRPLDSRIHALRGNLALYFDDKDEEVRLSFLRERILKPGSVMVPYRQGMSWIGIDQGETARRWGEALERAADRPALERIYRLMLRESRSRPLLRQFCIGIAARRGELAGLLIQGWSVKIMQEEEKGISSALNQLGDRELLKSFNKLMLSESHNRLQSPKKRQ